MPVEDSLTCFSAANQPYIGTHLAANRSSISTTITIWIVGTPGPNTSTRRNVVLHTRHEYLLGSYDLW
jgi:hypothetical protein